MAALIRGREFLHAGDVVVLECEAECIFRLTDDVNFEAWQQGHPFSYEGGTFKQFPARLTVPQTGFWNVTLQFLGTTSLVPYALSYDKKT